MKKSKTRKKQKKIVLPPKPGTFAHGFNEGEYCALHCKNPLGIWQFVAGLEFGFFAAGLIFIISAILHILH